MMVLNSKVHKYLNNSNNNKKMTLISSTDLIIYHGLLDFKADIQIFALDQLFQGLEKKLKS